MLAPDKPVAALPRVFRIGRARCESSVLVHAQSATVDDRFGDICRGTAIDVPRLRTIDASAKRKIQGPLGPLCRLSLSCSE